MAKLIAFIDGSTYAQSVLDHAAWVVTTIGASVDVVHVIGRRDLASTPADLSGSLELGARTSLLNELAEHDAQRAKLIAHRPHSVGQAARISGVTSAAVSLLLVHLKRQGQLRLSA